MKHDSKAKQLRSLAKTLAMAAALMFAAIGAAPAHAGGPAASPADPSATQAVTYLECLLRQQPVDIRDAAETLVYQCGYTPTQPVEEFVEQAVGNAPTAAYVPVAQQLAPYRNLYTAQQYAYFGQLDDIFQTSTSFEEMSRRLQDLESRAIAGLGRSERDLNVIGSVSAARYGFEFIKHYQNSGVSAKGFWQDLKRVGAVVGAFAGGFAIGGPIGAALAAWAVMAIIAN